MEQIEQEKNRLRAYRVGPGSKDSEKFNKKLKSPISKANTLEELLCRPEMNYCLINEIIGFDISNIHPQARKQVEDQIKYAGYIKHEQEEIEKQQKNENTLLPLDFDYNGIPGLSREVISKLNDFKPETIGKALRISGITPAAISILLVHLKKRGLLKKDKSSRNESE